ncbi:ADP-ribosyl-[dinitrogen reductase] glycohydrolase [Abditibacteriota bacterium]|nr:ADP-ribosyl-[dinitrogen reductase] glycohydrolase [Abditibacteriota bacterium]
MTSSQLRGALYGLLVGDALGVPYEFKAPERLPPLAQIEMTPPQGWPRAHLVPDGTWSDDGAQALALLDSLLECGGLDLEDLAKRIAQWQFEGSYAVEGQVFDVGITTSNAISRYRSGIKAEDAGPDDELSNGNGSLMRVLPLALWHQGDDFALARDAMRQSLVTHGHLRSQLCCALFCLWARHIAFGVVFGFDSETAWGNATTNLRALLPSLCRAANLPNSGDELANSIADLAYGEWENELEWHIRPADDLKGWGSGYVVDCLRSVRDAMRQPNYEAVVKYAVSLGDDTDTTACIAGGLAGLREGFEAIPTRWLEKLRGKEIIEPILECFGKVNNG